jgi:hypothetical protein
VLKLPFSRKLKTIKTALKVVECVAAIASGAVPYLVILGILEDLINEGFGDL